MMEMGKTMVVEGDSEVRGGEWWWHNDPVAAAAACGSGGKGKVARK